MYVPHVTPCSLVELYSPSKINRHALNTYVDDGGKTPRRLPTIEIIGSHAVKA